MPEMLSGPANNLVDRIGRIIHLIESMPPDVRSRYLADCAEHVLPLFYAEDRRPGDNRPRAAIAAARLYTEGHPARVASACSVGVTSRRPTVADYAAESAYAAASGAVLATLTFAARSNAMHAACAPADAATTSYAREYEKELAWQTNRLALYEVNDV